MISFANPVWLWGLLGLTVPIAIHLLSRKEGKIIYFGSLRHLEDSDTAQFSSIRLNEILLLLLRILLLTMLVLILAGLNFSEVLSSKKKWVLIEKGIEQHKQYRALIDTLTEEGYEARLLSKGFPSLSDSSNETKTSYYALLDELTQEKVDTAVILSFNYAKRFKGQLPALPKNVSWLSVDPSPISGATSAITVSDSVVTRNMTSSPLASSFEYRKTSRLEFEKTNSDSLSLKEQPIVRLAIVAEPEFSYDKKMIVAVLKAIETSLHWKFEINDSADDHADFIFWFSRKKTPSGANVIQFARCQNQNLPLLLYADEASGYCFEFSKSKWLLTRRLSEEVVLKENLTMNLAKIIAAEIDNYSLIYSLDHRTLPNQLAFGDKHKTEDVFTQRQLSKASAEPFLYFILVLTLMIERFVAFKRKQ